MKKSKAAIFLPPIAAKFGSMCRGFQSPLNLYKAALSEKENIPSLHCEIGCACMNINNYIFVMYIAVLFFLFHLCDVLSLSIH